MAQCGKPLGLLWYLPSPSLRSSQEGLLQVPLHYLTTWTTIREWGLQGAITTVELSLHLALFLLPFKKLFSDGLFTSPLKITFNYFILFLTFLPSIIAVFYIFVDLFLFIRIYFVLNVFILFLVSLKNWEIICQYTYF